MNKPELPPHYTVIECADDPERPYCAELFERVRYFSDRAEALEDCWDHWRENADPVWVEYLNALLDEQREPFTGFEDVTDEQRAIAQAEADRNADSFAAAKMALPTADEVIFAAHLQQFAAAAQREPGAKSSKLVHAIFDDRSPQGQACSLMLAQLVTRLYRSPYPGLNAAGVDFINVLVPVIAVAFSGLKKSTPKRGMAKGKRPS